MSAHTAGEAHTRPPPATQRPGVRGTLSTTFTLIRKDIRLEWKSRARINATIFFSILTLLLFSFAAGPKPKLLAANAPGYLWLALLLSSTLALGESMRVEVDNEAMEGLRLVPVDARAIYLSKALVNALFLCLLCVLVVPLAIALYNVEVKEGVLNLISVMTLGCFAIAAPGTFYAGISSQVRARDVLLPLLLFPILVPSLISSVAATGLVFEGDAMGQLPSWTSLLVAFNVIYWVMCTLLFGRVIEE
ncbi:MAG: heme exporter protein CcmB [Myxococcota bacterium]